MNAAGFSIILALQLFYDHELREGSSALDSWGFASASQLQGRKKRYEWETPRSCPDKFNFPYQSQCTQCRCHAHMEAFLVSTTVWDSTVDTVNHECTTSAQMRLI